MAGCCAQTRRQHVPLAEVFAAFGLLNEARPLPGREDVFFDETTQCDVFFITLKKSERLFSPTTRYNDYAISPWEFHWESQSLTRNDAAVSVFGVRGLREPRRRAELVCPRVAIRWQLHRAMTRFCVLRSGRENSGMTTEKIR